MPRIYVSSLLKSVPVAVNAVASDAICSKRLTGSAVGLNGKSFLLFLLSTKLPARLRFFRFSEKHQYRENDLNYEPEKPLTKKRMVANSISSSMTFLPRLKSV